MLPDEIRYCQRLKAEGHTPDYAIGMGYSDKAIMEVWG